MAPGADVHVKRRPAPRRNRSAVSGRRRRRGSGARRTFAPLAANGGLPTSAADRRPRSWPARHDPGRSDGADDHRPRCRLAGDVHRDRRRTLSARAPYRPHRTRSRPGRRTAKRPAGGPKLDDRRVKTKIKRAAFRKKGDGFDRHLGPRSGGCRFRVDRRGGPRDEIARAFNLTLASRRLSRSAGRRMSSLKPSKTSSGRPLYAGPSTGDRRDRRRRRPFHDDEADPCQPLRAGETIPVVLIAAIGVSAGATRFACCCGDSQQLAAGWRQ